MKKLVQLLLVLLVSGVAGGLLAALYFFEGAAPTGLLSALNWMMAFCGVVFFVSLCGCVFVSEQTRRRRFGLWMSALGCFGVLNVLSDWLKPVENFECGGEGVLEDSICLGISHLPMSLQNPAWFLVLLFWLIVCFYITCLGWKIYVDER